MPFITAVLLLAFGSLVDANHYTVLAFPKLDLHAMFIIFTNYEKVMYLTLSSANSAMIC